MVLNATFNNISVILWHLCLLVEETAVPKRVCGGGAIVDRLNISTFNSSSSTKILIFIVHLGFSRGLCIPPFKPTGVCCLMRKLQLYT